MLPICSFTISGKFTLKSQIIPNPKTLGDHLRNERFKRKQSQGMAATLIGVVQSYLSLWELNKKEVPEKYKSAALNYIRQENTVFI